MIIPEKELTPGKLLDILDKAFDATNEANRASQHILVIKDLSSIRMNFLVAKKYTIGRSKDNDIQISSKGISRHHATLRKRQNKFWIFDGSTNGRPSTNGLKVNQRTCRSSKIASGDIINFYSDSCAMFFELKPGSDYLSSKEELIEKVMELGLGSYTTGDHTSSDHSFLDILPDFIIKLDSNGVVVNLKESKDEIFSAYGKSLVAQAISDCFPPQISEAILESMQAARETGQAQSFDCEIVGNGKKKSLRNSGFNGARKCLLCNFQEHQKP